MLGENLVSQQKISFTTTVFNSMPWVVLSLASLIDTCKVLQNNHKITCEIIIVDNFSEDGTFEEIKRQQSLTPDILIKATRYKCKRGLGRQIAVALSSGTILVYVDMDVIYDPNQTACLITSYFQNPLVANTALYLSLVPRTFALKVGGFQDLNRAEDVEFCARLTKEYKVLPLIDSATLEFFHNDLGKVHGKEHSQSSKMVVDSYGSERRYASNFFNYLRRDLNNKIDTVRGLGLTPTKIVRENWFLHKLRGMRFLSRLSYYLCFWFITRIIGKTIFEHSKNLSNNVLCEYLMMKNYTNLLGQEVKNGLIEEAYSNRLLNAALDYGRTRSMVEYARAVGN
jgi:glycosyltransferase involved in cell wall biosynthesis